jgi:hypothetical protein
MSPSRKCLLLSPKCKYIIIVTFENDMPIDFALHRAVGADELHNLVLVQYKDSELHGRLPNTELRPTFIKLC